PARWDARPIRSRRPSTPVALALRPTAVACTTSLTTPTRRAWIGSATRVGNLEAAGLQSFEIIDRSPVHVVSGKGVDDKAKAVYFDEFIARISSLHRSQPVPLTPVNADVLARDQAGNLFLRGRSNIEV